MVDILKLDSAAANFGPILKALLSIDQTLDARLEAAVADILADVRRRGDAAVLEYTRRFDRLEVADMSALCIPRSALESAFAALPGAQREALVQAAGRIRSYHERQVQSSWSHEDAEGNRLGQKVTPLERVGIYVPGGKAAYPSTVMMNALPARVAGVGEIIMVVPTPDGERNGLVMAAAALCGVDRVYAVGGAQAVGALAYGTQTIPAVDKIVGPGNAYVASAKRQVFGTVGIDMVAGPSEVLVISDGSSDPDWVAMDLFSQAEHDEKAQALLLCPDALFIEAVAVSMARLVKDMPRREIILTSLKNRGALIKVRDLDEACQLANQIAPEHLELSVNNPEALIDKIRNAGAIFMGHYTSEALGDYCAGPNHVLPTARTARFSSPLGVYDFQKRTSVIQVSRKGAGILGRVAAELARGEGLPAHARSAEMRLHR
ncbi:MAG: histidinol dehydrogenase [Betaproteobacteria bacterium]|nr:histidinol dehydrogenase [Betaproteobacteria bacterium]